MSSQLDIILLDNSNNILEEITITKPKSFKELNIILKNKLKNLSQKFNIFYPSSNNIEIEILNEEDYQLSKDILFIHKIEQNDLNNSLFDINYDKLAESQKEILNDKFMCSICSELVKNEKPYYCYTCQKIFHHKCLENWDKKRDINETLTCPICREILPLYKWKEKLDYEEERIKEGKVMNDLNRLKTVNEKKNEIIENYKNYTEKITKLLKNILIRINEIHLLFYPNFNEKLNNLIKDFSIDFISPEINDISTIILDELYILEKDIKSNEKINIINNEEKKIINKKSDYINVINLIYDNKKEEITNIFGEKYVKANKDNIELIINGERSPLVDKYILKKGENNIKMLIKNNILNLEYMFENCSTLKNIEDLKNLNTKEITNFSHIFSGCSSLSDITALKNWDVSKSNTFQFIFCGCCSLSDITPLENWDVSNCKYFQSMFYECSLLSNITPIKNWNVSKGKDFSFMFDGCFSLSNISSLEKWDISNGYNFQYFFCECKSLSNINCLKKWNFSSCNNFSYMFYKCSNLSNIDILNNWNVSNGKFFQSMFYKCINISDITALKGWNISKGNNFENMFFGCSSLLSKKPLENWNFPLNSKIQGMFDKCELLSE